MSQALAAPLTQTTTVLGVDPGQRTGVAIVDVGPRAPYTVVTLATVADDQFVNWVRELTQESTPDAVAIEDWEHQGPAKSHGAMYQGFNAGRCVGIMEAFGVSQVALLRRREVLTAFGVRTEKALHHSVRYLTDLGERHATLHELDAIAIAIAGAGRFGPIFGGDRFNRTPRPRRPRRKR